MSPDTAWASWPWIVLAVPVLVPLAIALLNVWGWPRRGTGAPADGTVSVLVPARNEVAHIGACVQAALAVQPPVDEVIVYDDGSTDGTSEVLAELAGRDPRLKVVQGAPLPDGWVGKPHATHQLGSHATGSLLLFIDADVVLAPDAVAAMRTVLADHDAEVVTAVPRQVTVTWAERWIVPLLHLTYAGWLPMPLVWLSADPRFLAANGQLLLVRRDAYDAVGGFAAVRHEVVDDMAFCRRMKAAGRRVVFADAHHWARCRMYSSPREVWEGFSKNLYEGIGGTPVALGAVLVLYIGTFVLPYVALAVGILAGRADIAAAAAVGCGGNLALRGLLAVRHGHPWTSVLAHPLAVLGLMAIAVNSWRWTRRHTVRWAGRTYAGRADREAA